MSPSILDSISLCSMSAAAANIVATSYLKAESI